ncbi:FAD:protein FMN transferase [Sulfitobacter sp. PM12]|uniref:FAD:protein FMN transferase n=1 Tax=Sulfitobacter sp. PM12 TaxID=3138497 RepID=UPI00388F14B1
MKLNRRRFLSISAACMLATPARAQIHRWQGRALGAEVEITLHAPADIAIPALEHARALLDRIMAQFDLFDPASTVSRLNRTGHLDAPDVMFRRLMQACTQVHAATGGLFDPTVQPLWRALAEGQPPEAARALIDWSRVRHSAASVTLGEGQALTFNGIAQGFATDLVAEALRDAGLERTLVNIGEFRGTGGPWRLGISDPEIGMIGTRTLTSSAIATSSPKAVPLGGQGHILHGHAKPRWSTVSVEAATATMADGFSTALTMARLEDIRAAVGTFGIRRITLVSDQGDVSRVEAPA